MSIAALDALQAYGRVGGLPASSPKSTPDVAPGGFGTMVDLVTNAAGAMRAAESASAAQVAGKGDLVDVVTAIGTAEMALDTVVAVRDRVVNAYSEIMRMQI